MRAKLIKESLNEFDRKDNLRDEIGIGTDMEWRSTKIAIKNVELPKDPDDRTPYLVAGILADAIAYKYDENERLAEDPEDPDMMHPKLIELLQQWLDKNKDKIEWEYNIADEENDFWEGFIG